jgi:serine protease AprX
MFRRSTPPLRRRATAGSSVIAFVVALALAMVAAGSGLSPATASPAMVEVVVQESNPATGAAEAAVAGRGGRVGPPLAIVDGFAATIPAGQLASLSHAPGVVNVTVNREVTLSGQYGENSGVASAVYSDAVRASATWSNGWTGDGIGVALIDTGVNATGDLAGKVTYAVDFTSERDNVDSFGHGTFVAGLIAGQGTASGGGVKGVAPGAHLVSVKIAGADGTTDLFRLLAALEWVATYKDALGIRVVNLSLGAVSDQSYLVDPVNLAVERVWNSGIVVVAAAGNKGPGAGTIVKPGDDPLVITVGAADDRTTAATGDDTVAPFSSAGPTAGDGLAKPDVVASGKSVVSTRASGSTIDDAHPESRIGDRYFKGSGTSFSAPIVAGAAALVIDRTWTLNPNQVKYRLMSTARRIAGADAASQGAGEVDALAATLSDDKTAANAGVVGAGSNLLWYPRLAALLGSSWAGSSWAGSSWAGSSWAGSSWAGSSWAGSSWAGSSWAGSQWDGSSWAGSSWAGSSWAGSSWAGSSWAGSSWAGSSWAGSSWAGSSWAGSSWAGSSWAGSSWAGSSWAFEPSVVGWQ